MHGNKNVDTIVLSYTFIVNFSANSPAKFVLDAEEILHCQNFLLWSDFSYL